LPKVTGEVYQLYFMSINQQEIQQNLQDIQQGVQENLPKNLDDVGQKFDQAHDREENAIARAKDTLVDKLPIATAPASITSGHATVHELKSRLNWGEPGLTILDVRDREAFDDCHILGAMNVPMSMMPDAVQDTLQDKRDIYVYGDEATAAAQTLRSAGFKNVAELQGGLAAWQEVGGSVDGVKTQTEPSAGAYNVVSRLKEFAEERAKEKQIG
jgi:rhodanese-related sulfurtransferase